MRDSLEQNAALPASRDAPFTEGRSNFVLARSPLGWCSSKTYYHPPRPLTQQCRELGSIALETGPGL